MNRRVSIALAVASLALLAEPCVADARQIEAGCKVMPRASDLTITSGGRVVRTAAEVDWPLPAKYVGDGFVYFYTGEFSGWMKQSDLLTLDEAIAYYGEQIQQTDRAEDKAAFYRLRAFAQVGLQADDAALADFSEALKLNTSVSCLLDRADLLYGQENLQASEHDCEAALALDPHSARAYRLGARINAARTRNDQALADIERAIKLSPQEASGYMLRGMLQLTGNDRPRAFADLDQAVSRAPTSENYARRAIYYITLKDFASAECDLQNSLAVEPDFEEATLLKAAVCTLQGRPVQIDTRSSDPEVAAGLSCMRAISFVTQKDYVRALAEVDEAERLNLKMRGELWMMRAGIQMTAENYQAAIDLLNERIQQHPTDAAAFSFRGTCYKDLGEYAKALADYEKVTGLTAESAQAFENCGSTRLKLGDYHGAIDDLNRAVRLAPTRPNAYFGRAQVLVKLNRYSRAIADCQRAIELRQADIATQREQANQKGNQVTVGISFRSTGKTDEQQANTSLAAYYAVRSQCHYARGSYREAIADFQQALQFDPESRDGLKTQAWFRATCPETELRDGAQAVTSARTACETSKWRDADCLSALAAACAEAGDNAAAADYQKRAIALVPQPELQAAQQRLELYRQQRPYRMSPVYRLAELF